MSWKADGSLPKADSAHFRADGALFGNTGYAPGDCWAPLTWFSGSWAFNTWNKAFTVGSPRTRKIRGHKFFFKFL